MEERNYFHTKLQNLLARKRVGRQDLKSYLKSLAGLTRTILKDAINYKEFSPVLKEQLASFKTIFGKHQSNVYCAEATIIYTKLLTIVMKFEPAYVYELYRDWGDMLVSFTSSSRTDAFIKHISNFQYVVEHLKKTDNRWCQLNILSVLRLYTKRISRQQIRDLHASQPSSFLEIIAKVISLPHQQELSFRSSNAFLSDSNLKEGFNLSFQPYKIVCGDEIYVLTDYELWVDWNIRTKSITFIAMSVKEDNSKSLYGVASMQLKIVSCQDSLNVKSKWRLNTKANSKIRKMKIEFCFSARIHTAILDSLSNVFNIVQLDETGMNKNVKAVIEPNQETNTILADEPILPSINEINFDELEIFNTQPAENRIQRKRRRVQEPDDEENEAYGKRLKDLLNVKPISNEVTPLSMKNENPSGLFVEKAIEINSNNEKHFHDLEEVIQTTADDVIHTLGYVNTQKSFNESLEEDHSQHFSQRSFDHNVWRGNWLIRKFVRAQNEEEDCGDDADIEDIVSLVSDDDGIDVHYGSVSNPETDNKASM